MKIDKVESIMETLGIAPDARFLLPYWLEVKGTGMLERFDEAVLNLDSALQIDWRHGRQAVDALVRDVVNYFGHRYRPGEYDTKLANMPERPVFRLWNVSGPGPRAPRHLVGVVRMAGLDEAGVVRRLLRAVARHEGRKQSERPS